MCSAVEPVFAQDLPNLSVADAEADETDETDDADDQADATMHFVVSLDASASGEVTVGHATSDGTAVAVDDYVSASGTLTFARGELSRTVSVSLVDDDRDEPTETFAMTLSSPTNATMDTATADGTVIDNDGAPQLSIVGAGGSEGGVLDFVVTLAGSGSERATVGYAAAALQTGQLRIAAVVAQSRFDTGDRRGTGLRIWKLNMRSVRSDAGLPIPCT